jgi:hypothetical protein
MVHAWCGMDVIVRVDAYLKLQTCSAFVVRHMLLDFLRCEIIAIVVCKLAFKTCGMLEINIPVNQLN